MAKFIHPTTFEEREETNENISAKLIQLGWIGPDPVNPGSGVEKKHWKFISPDFVEMTQEEKDALPKNIPNVTARQLRVALFLTMGLTDANIDAAINTLSDPTKTVAMIEWKESNEFERNRPLVATMGAMLNKTDAELDALWLYAGAL